MVGQKVRTDPTPATNSKEFPLTFVAACNVTYLLGAEVKRLVLLVLEVSLERIAFALADERVDNGNGLAHRLAARQKEEEEKGSARKGPKGHG